MTEIPCKYCKEPIREEARRCPHCQSFQSDKHPLDGGQGMRTALVIVLPMFLVLALVCVVGIVHDSHQSSVKDRVDARTCLAVTESEIVACNGGNDRCITVRGRLQNKSPHEWAKVAFHVDFMDKDARVIDTCSFVDYDLIVLPQQETTFRFLFKPVCDLPADSTHKIEIRWAQQLD